MNTVKSVFTTHLSGIILLVASLLNTNCVAGFPDDDLGQNLLITLALVCRPPECTITAPRFASIGTDITIEAPTDKRGQFTQTAGDTVTTITSTANSLTFQSGTVPAETLQFAFREKGVAGNCQSVAARVTVLESTSSPVYVNAAYSTVSINRNGEARPSGGGWSVGAY